MLRSIYPVLGELKKVKSRDDPLLTKAIMRRDLALECAFFYTKMLGSTLERTLPPRAWLEELWTSKCQYRSTLLELVSMLAETPKQRAILTRTYLPWIRGLLEQGDKDFEQHQRHYLLFVRSLGVGKGRLGGKRWLQMLKDSTAGSTEEGRVFSLLNRSELPVRATRKILFAALLRAKDNWTVQDRLISLIRDQRHTVPGLNQLIKKLIAFHPENKSWDTLFEAIATTKSALPDRGPLLLRILKRKDKVFADTLRTLKRVHKRPSGAKRILKELSAKLYGETERELFEELKKSPVWTKK